MDPLEAIRYSCILQLEADINEYYDFHALQGVLSDASTRDSVSLSYLTFSENVTYVVNDSNQRPIGIVTLHRPGYHTVAELGDELLWMHEIRTETTVSVPQVFRDRDGKFLRPLAIRGVGRFYYSLCSFVPGTTLEALEGGCTERVAREVGKIAATLHRQSQMRARRRKALSCFQWDLPHLLGPQARWGNFDAYPVSDVQRQILHNGAYKIKSQLWQYGQDETNYFLIHADLHAGNLLVDHDAVTLIDFDDCGYSWFLYDLGSFLSRQDDNLTSLANAWCTGYETIRPLREKDVAMIPTFILLRRLVRLGWLASHTGNDVASRVDSAFLEVTLMLTEQYIRYHKASQIMAAM